MMSLLDKKLRIGAAALCGSLLSSLAAEASSIAAVEPPREKISASMMEIGAPKLAVVPPTAPIPSETNLAILPADLLPAPKDASASDEAELVAVSPSVLAMRAPEELPAGVPPVSNEAVAAIPQASPKAPDPFRTPVVMRGGIVDDATSAAPAAPTPAAGTPAPTGASSPKSSPAPSEETEPAAPPPPPAALPPSGLRGPE